MRDKYTALATTTTGPAPLAEGHPTCSCGQELDVCRREHCPRCGHRIQDKMLAGVAA